jgi:hypothetical protein
MNNNGKEALWPMTMSLSWERCPKTFDNMKPGEILGLNASPLSVHDGTGRPVRMAFEGERTTALGGYHREILKVFKRCP